MRRGWQREPDGKERTTEFNKVQQGRKDCTSSEKRFCFSFYSFTTSAYLNTFTPRPFICVCIHWPRNSWTQRETLVPVLFECWPRMATICANCLTPWLSCMQSQKYQRHFLKRFTHCSRSSVTCLGTISPFMLSLGRIIFSKQWFPSSIIWQPCVPFTVASGAFVFLILSHKENLFSVSRNPAYTYLLLGTEKPSSKLKHTRGSGENGVDDIVFSDMDVRLKESVGWMLSCQ